VGGRRVVSAIEEEHNKNSPSLWVKRKLKGNAMTLRGRRKGGGPIISGMGGRRRGEYA